MNIFYLDTDPRAAAEYHCDKHVVKMIVETAQLLSTAHRVLDGELWIDASSGRRIKRWKLQDQTLENAMYKATHINHPSAKWVREAEGNYNWTYKLFANLCLEYTYRYGKMHATSTKLLSFLSQAPKNINKAALTSPPQAMPDYCKDPDPVTGYRNYYTREKSNMLKYTKRGAPSWLV